MHGPTKHPQPLWADERRCEFLREHEHAKPGGLMGEDIVLVGIFHGQTAGFRVLGSVFISYEPIPPHPIVTGGTQLESD